jgi:hypothetical protein
MVSGFGGERVHHLPLIHVLNVGSRVESRRPAMSNLRRLRPYNNYWS